MRLPILTALFTLALAPAANAELYRWVDKDGRVVYSDIPPPMDTKSEAKPRVKDTSDGTTLPYATQIAAKKYPVTLYSNECGEPCAQAKALLAKRGVPYALKNPETSEGLGNELKKLIGSLEVPVLVVGKDQPLRGFLESGWNSVLDTAGYPKGNAGVRGELVKDAAKEEEKVKALASAKPAPAAPPVAKTGPYAEVEPAVPSKKR
jgi:glutaredoxin